MTTLGPGWKLSGAFRKNLDWKLNHLVTSSRGRLGGGMLAGMKYPASSSVSCQDDSRRTWDAADPSTSLLSVYLHIFKAGSSVSHELVPWRKPHRMSTSRHKDVLEAGNAWCFCQSRRLGRTWVKDLSQMGRNSPQGKQTSCEWGMGGGE